LDPLFYIAEKFTSAASIIDIRPHGKGNVNDTFLVTLKAPAQDKFILQRLNSRVFPRPELVMKNMRTVIRHLQDRLPAASLGPGRRWEIPRLLRTGEGRDYWIDPQGSFWRALVFIEKARSFDRLEDLGQAREAGYALGLFHHLLSGLPVEKLVETLKGFHITPLYLRHYNRVLETHALKKSAEVDYGRRFIERRRPWAGILEKAKEEGRLRLRPIHGDPKVNNVLMDLSSRQAVSLIDLDTVQPGLVQYDIGDLLRSGANPLGEETDRWETVRFEIDFCQAILEGYLSQAGGFLIDQDYEYLFDALRLIAFELGLRFFTDYLEGNVYFKTASKEQNLLRALVQFRLTEGLEAQEAAIRSVIRDLKRPLNPNIA
jgi:Ser/Thr protein kinase RdoA (MazF antagonist)